MSPAYIEAVVTHLPNATLVFDRFHVIKLYGDKLSELRRDLHRQLADTMEKSVLKGIRWLLLKRPENLDPTRNEPQRLQHRHVMLLRVLFDSPDEPLGDVSHPVRRHRPLPVVLPEKVKHPPGRLEQRLIDVQIHPIEGFQLQRDVLVDDLGNSPWYTHGRLRMSGRKRPPTARRFHAQGPSPCFRRSGAVCPDHCNASVGLRRSLARVLPCNMRAPCAHLVQ